MLDRWIAPMKIIVIIGKILQQQEIQILSRIDHPHIIKFVRSFVEGNAVYILTEFCEDGDLSIKINVKRLLNKSFNTVLLSHWLYLLIDAVSYLHSQLIIHRDIKPSNIFLNQHQNIKLGDFGVSKQFGETSTTNLSTYAGTSKYMPPEIMTSGQTYSFNTDCWSLGCVLFELITLEVFSNENLNAYEAIEREI